MPPVTSKRATYLSPYGKRAGSADEQDSTVLTHYLRDIRAFPPYARHGRGAGRSRQPRAAGRCLGEALSPPSRQRRAVAPAVPA